MIGACLLGCSGFEWQRLEPVAPPPGAIDLRGAVHVHSNRSDGCASLDDILSEARLVGLDYIVLTDHNHRGDSVDQGDVLVVGGAEFGPTGHLLGIGHTEDFTSRQPREVLAECIHRTGGIAVAAHPFDPFQPFPPESLPRMDGMEIYSFSSDIDDEGIPLYALKLLIFPFNRWGVLKTVVDVPEESLHTFDRILQEKDFLGLGGADAHGCTGVRHAMPFSIVQTHVQARERSVAGILEALRARRAYVSFEYRSPLRAFDFTLETDGAMLPMGSTLALPASGSFHVRVQPAATIRLLVNGEVAGNWPAASEVREPLRRPGAYRVEVWLDGELWILSNAIRVLAP